MGNSLANPGWARLTSAHKGMASLVGCFGLMAGQICAAQTAHPGGAVNMGTVKVGKASATGTVTFTFDTGGTLDSSQPFKVVTQGATNLDFVSAAGSTCNGTTSYTESETCQVNVSFHPKYPGPRFGAVLLYGSAGSVIATAYVYGAGTAPLVTFAPGATSVVPGPPSIYQGLTTDATGRVFIVNDQSTLQIDTPSGDSYTQSVTYLTPPYPAAGSSGIVVDGAGNIFTNSGGYELELSPSGTGYTESLAFGGLVNPDQIAADGNGDLFITEHQPDKVIKAVRSASGYTHSAINTSIMTPGAVAVDGSGIVYVTGNANVYKLTPSGGSYTQSTIVEGTSEEGYGSGLAVDAAGDVYVSGEDASPTAPNGAVFKATPSGGGYVLSTVLPDLYDPDLLALGENGNLYSVSSFDDRATQIEKMTLATAPSLTFAATASGSISSDSPQTIAVANIGNASLTFPIPESGDNPTISSNFTLDSSSEGDCPLTSSGSSSAGMLAAGASCLLPISFEPEAPASGNVTGTLNLTDDTLNAASPSYAVQSIALAGAVPGPPFGNLATPVDSVTGTNRVSQADSVKIVGWVADPVDHAPMSNVTVYIDGTSVGKPTLGIAKEVVAEDYGNADLDSGYQMLYPAPSLAVGTHHVTVIAIDSDGFSKTFGPVSFTVAAP
jgi:sugar lactone lactonase YvrE